jgi:hypothetical protein
MSSTTHFGLVRSWPIKLTPGCFAVLPLPHIKEIIQFIRDAAALPTPPDGFGVTTAMGIIVKFLL